LTSSFLQKISVRHFNFLQKNYQKLGAERVNIFLKYVQMR